MQNIQIKKALVDHILPFYESSSNKQETTTIFNEWEYNSFTRQQAYQIMTNGICCAGAKYQFFYFSDGQLRDKVCWFYSLNYHKILIPLSHYEMIWVILKYSKSGKK